MAVHPIESRYKTPMYDFFTEEHKLEKWLEVECALVKAYETLGKVPKGTAKKVESASSKVSLKRVNEIEEQIHHDVMSMVRALSEQCGDAGNYIHLGATSYDIVDTSWGLIFKDVLPMLEQDLSGLLKALLEKAETYKDLVCIGRTHGQHAIPTTLGYKFALYALDISRHMQRLKEITPRLLVGKMSGAVGNYASFTEYGDRVEKEVMKELNLTPIPSTQVVPRDAHAEYLFLLSLIGQSLTRLGLEIRNLQRSEIRELEEPFGSKQVGSSTMPQKRNPHKSERVCGLARILKAQVLVGLDNIPLEHERDLTNSAAERISLPESSILADYILREMIKIVQGLKVYEENIKRNLASSKGLFLSEAVMIALVDKGMGRQEAHELVRESAMRSFETDEEFSSVLMRAGVGKYLKEKELSDLLKPEKYTGLASKKATEIVRKLHAKA
jgi:adenylosuccinate lyase